MTDFELFEKFQQNPEAGLELAYKKYGKRVYNTIFNLVQDVHEAEEITQDVFVKFYRSFAEFNQDAKISTWIFRIGVNASLDALRRRKRKKNVQRFTRFFIPEVDNERIEDKKITSPIGALESSELSEILLNAIDQLPESQKSAFVLVKVQGMSYPEAAEVMQKSLSSVESLLVRANRRLKELLSAFYEENYK